MAEDEKSGAIALTIPFRGERDYLHSTTILTELATLFPLDGRVALEFRQMIHHPVRFQEEPCDGSERVGSFRFSNGAVARRFGIFTDPGRTVDGRVACNEKAIIGLYDKGADAATGIVGAPGNFIETVVALNKAAVGRHAGSGKKVIFSAIKLDRLPTSGEAGIELTKKLGTKLFVSDVFSDGGKIGNLTFMAV